MDFEEEGGEKKLRFIIAAQSQRIQWNKHNGILISSGHTAVIWIAKNESQKVFIGPKIAVLDNPIISFVTLCIYDSYESMVRTH